MKKSSARFRFFAASLLLSALVFVIPALKDGNATLYLLAAAVPCAMLLLGTVIPRMFSLDRMIISLVLWLCAAGIAALARTELSDEQADAIAAAQHDAAAAKARIDSSDFNSSARGFLKRYQKFPTPTLAGMVGLNMPCAFD